MVKEGKVGWAVDLDGPGNTLAVGAPGRGGGLTDPRGPGQILVYSRGMNSIWANRQSLLEPDDGIDHGYGQSLTLSKSGATLAAGAPFADGATTTSGRVLLFRRSNGVWSFDTTIEPEVGSSGDEFGRSVDLATGGQRLVVGAAMEDSITTALEPEPMDAGAPDSGAAYVYRIDAHAPPGCGAQTSPGGQSCQLWDLGGRYRRRGRRRCSGPRR